MGQLYINTRRPRLPPDHEGNLRRKRRFPRWVVPLRNRPFPAEDAPRVIGHLGCRVRMSGLPFVMGEARLTRVQLM
jgi:hypothetical protein